MVLLINVACLSADEWIKKEKMQFPRLMPSVAEVDGKIYVMGGFHQGKVTDKNEMYDPIKDRWEEMKPMLTGRAGLTTTIIDDKIYTIGGMDQALAVVPSVEIYDPKTNSWIEKTEIPEPKQYHSASSIDNKIYILGGEFAMDKASLSIYVYGVANDTWEKLKDMPINFHVDGSIAFPINNKIYIFSGFNWATFKPRDKVLIYDPQNETWEEKAEIPTKRYVPTAGMIDRKVYVIGGVDLGLNAYSVVEEYDIDTDTWTRKTDMPSKRGYFGTSPSCVIDGKIYVIGGVTNWADGLTNNEVYVPDGKFSINPQDKLSSTWGNIKSIK